MTYIFFFANEFHKKTPTFLSGFIFDLNEITSRFCISDIHL